MSAMKIVAVFLALGMGMAAKPVVSGNANVTGNVTLNVTVPHASMVSVHRAKGKDILAIEKVTPLEKVTSLLEDLKDDVTAEAKDEAKAYDKFACFCKDNTEEKGDSIKEGQTTIDDQTAIIEEKSAEQAEKTTEMAEFKKEAESLKREIQKLDAQRSKEKAEYEILLADLEQAIERMEKAIDELEASKPSLLELKASKPSLLAVQVTIRKSMIFADALGLPVKHMKTINAFLQGTEAPGDYEFHSQNIIDILEELKTDFTKHKDEKVEEEEKAAKAHETLIEEKKEMLKTQEDGAADCEKIIDECKEAIADAELELGQAEAELKDNQLYLKDLTERCEGKAKQWDQRSKARADEVQALTSALETIKGDKVKEAKRALLQQSEDEKESTTVVEKSVVQEDAFAGAGAGEDDVGGGALSFLQRGTSKVPVAVHQNKATESSANNDRRSKAMALLTSEGKRLKSTLLISAASKVVTEAGKDPFKKIKQLIQALIEKLLTQMKDEATHKGFCDEEMGKAKNTRDSALEKTGTLNAQLMKLEVRKETNSETIDTLTDELEELNKSLEESTELRSDEKAENAETITSSKEGAEAVAQAIVILTDFYKKQGKAASLIQVQASPIDEEGENPGAGFDGDYKGKADAAGGIIGMLEVIQSDFERSVKQTSEAEAKSHRDFINFERTTKGSISEKETGKEQAETDLKSVKIALEEGMTDFKDTQKLLDETLKELEELNPQCVDTGMSYEERVAAREEEISALKKALDMLQPE